MSNFDYIETGGAPIRAWTRGVPIEDAARQQIENVARLPFIHKHVAIMPDVHWGRGATIGSVIVFSIFSSSHLPKSHIMLHRLNGGTQDARPVPRVWSSQEMGP